LNEQGEAKKFASPLFLLQAMGSASVSRAFRIFPSLRLCAFALNPSGKLGREPLPTTVRKTAGENEITFYSIPSFC